MADTNKIMVGGGATVLFALLAVAGAKTVTQLNDNCTCVCLDPADGGTDSAVVVPDGSSTPATDAQPPQTGVVSFKPLDMKCEQGIATTYDIGPGKQYANISDAPLENLAPGDVVRIYWRPEAYKEKMHISVVGEKDKPVKICGVPSPTGEMPVIDGQDAVSRTQNTYPYSATQERGIIILTPKLNQAYGIKPKYITIQGLKVINAQPGTAAAPVMFTNTEGVRRQYLTTVSPIFVERGEYITVRGCELTNSSFGLFVASGDDEATLSREITIEGNYIYGNGIIASDRRHNVYTEAAGVTMQFNRFGPERAGAIGNQIKDRSAGTVIRYNWIEGGAHLLDLVEPEDAYPLLTIDPRFRTTYVYGNVLVNGPADGSSLIHYGGDNGNAAIYRKGTLMFYHNTVVITSDQRQKWQTTMFRVETPDESVDARNNIFYKSGTTELTLMSRFGKLTLGKNWISQGFVDWKYPATMDGGVAGQPELIIGTNPGFTSVTDFSLIAGAQAANASGPLAAALDQTMLPTQQYVVHQSGKQRTASGTNSNLGAIQ